MHTDLLKQISLLTIDDQIDLVEAIWNGIASQNPPSTLTTAQRQELQNRLADDINNPDDLLPWEQVRDEALAQIG